MSNDNFGAGVFTEDTVVTGATPEGESPTPDSEPVTLTSEEEAIAGRDFMKNQDPEDWTEVDDSDPDDDEVDDDDEGWAPSKSDQRLATMYELSDEDLGRVDSQEALHTLIDILDKRASTNKGGSGNAGGSGESVSSDVPGEDGAASSPKKIDIKALEKKFAEKDAEGEFLHEQELAGMILDNAKAAVSAQEEVAKMRTENTERSQHTETAKRVEEFHKTLNGVSGLYGKMQTTDMSDLSKVQKASRREVGEHVATMMAGLRSQGRDLPTMKVMIEQAVRSLHGDKLAGVQKRSKNLRHQSSQRRSPGTKQTKLRGRPAQANADPYSAESIANDPEIVAFFDNAEFENGTR